MIAGVLADMPSPSWAAVATAAASVITAVGGIILSIAVLIPLLKTARSTHVLVNQSHTDALNYQNALIRALKNAGVNVPIDQSAPNGDTQNLPPSQQTGES